MQNSFILPSILPQVHGGEGGGGSTWLSDNMMMDKDQQDGGDCEDDGFIEKVDHRWFL